MFHHGPGLPAVGRWLHANGADYQAAVSLDPDGAGFKITRSALTLTADVPGLDRETFDKLAEAAEKTCPLSRVINAEITLDATLK